MNEINEMKAKKKTENRKEKRKRQTHLVERVCVYKCTKEGPPQKLTCSNSDCATNCVSNPITINVCESASMLECGWNFTIPSN